MLDVDDTYEGLPSKVVAAILWGTANDYDYFFKVDSDVFMMPTKFMAAFLSATPSTRAWTGWAARTRCGRRTRTRVGGSAHCLGCGISVSAAGRS